jgi:hypothetical protein
MVAKLLPANTSDRGGWARDIYAAFGALSISPSTENVCAAIAVAEQESSLQADPAVPGLADIAKKEIERRRESAGVPRMVVDRALALHSSDGRTYGERLDEVKTERQLSELYEDFVAQVPVGKSFLAERNPVRTGGPMQVSVAYAEAHASVRPYPYPVNGSIRHEVFSRRGGVYFGIAHLLDYPAAYPRMIYRFADFNAGHYASRNAAFQAALTQLSAIPLDLDGDLVRYDKGAPAKEPSATELAARAIAKRLAISENEIRRDLELGTDGRFEKSRLYARVFELADEVSGKAVPRAVLPRIALKSPKITRKLTTEWFAQRVEQRYESCLKRV